MGEDGRGKGPLGQRPTSPDTVTLRTIRADDRAADAIVAARDGADIMLGIVARTMLGASEEGATIFNVQIARIRSILRAKGSTMKPGDFFRSIESRGESINGFRRQNCNRSTSSDLR